MLNGTNLIGATNKALSLLNVTLSQAGNYSVRSRIMAAQF